MSNFPTLVCVCLSLSLLQEGIVLKDFTTVYRFRCCYVNLLNSLIALLQRGGWRQRCGIRRVSTSWSAPVFVLPCLSRRAHPPGNLAVGLSLRSLQQLFPSLSFSIAFLGIKDCSCGIFWVNVSIYKIHDCDNNKHCCLCNTILNQNKAMTLRFATTSMFWQIMCF